MEEDEEDGGMASQRARALVAQAAKGPGAQGSGINYHGGAVMTGTTKLAYIWYGSWGDPAAAAVTGAPGAPSTQRVLTDLAKSLGGSAWFGIAAGYFSDMGGVRRYVSNAVSYGGDAIGYDLTDVQAENVVACVLESQQLPLASDFAYFLLGGPDIHTTSGFCKTYCGYHSYGATHANQLYKYGFIGSPLACANHSSCAMQMGAGADASPSGNAEADAMASVIAHELAETVTDPYIDAWAGGGQANMRLGCPGAAGDCTSRDFLIQRNWVNSGGGYCALSAGLSR
ncbi:hypothetical protein WJX81_004509 [Elliptochloris bilobata]|uniref:Uncharacterized protein n=1 Tax=Elliptochloris bilobata TaxID=381761 RepID=A0AAW1RIH9_9CHLO